jgi:hypothetical protein
MEEKTHTRRFRILSTSTQLVTIGEPLIGIAEWERNGFEVEPRKGVQTGSRSLSEVARPVTGSILVTRSRVYEVAL